ncbi:PH domain-containing protein [Epilithonimonas bovis DSM 19482]|uniref:PH domain-containing protein n=1 Tax=Epilithonimonas bovis DSM 19482 TaxID=1121284 RepID=A0A1U7Q0V7_9FLAO|nr:PH domain-containing protein [Epilithonimonas bovis]SIT98182.1 PH domain-containing protein [Epilithonimonas bovis DSM 19482]
MKNIPVKIGWELVIPILLIIAVSNFSAIKSESWKALIAPVLILGFVLVVIFGIRYRIDSQKLYIQNSIFGTTKINIDEISRIEKTWNPLSSPAPSIFGRVQIYYTNGSIIISPKNYEEFKNELLKIKPNITVKD